MIVSICLRFTLCVCVCFCRFGPCNTRLMQAYSQFDERFALLVPFIRLWVKQIGCHRGSRQYLFNLNSYAVSLMLIYCLQCCTPPVLPCLQNPGTWPKNMDWFSKHGFQQQQQQQRLQLTVGPWSCDFVPPDSLLPSTNTQTPGTRTRYCMHNNCMYSNNISNTQTPGNYRS